MLIPIPTELLGYLLKDSNGKLISKDGKLSLIDGATGKQRQMLKEYEDSVAKSIKNEVLITE